MKIDVLSSDRSHPVRPYLDKWAEAHGRAHDVAILEDWHQCVGGDLLFLISCSDLISAELRANYGRTLVVHASDLPAGRGWSPLVWQVLEGRDEITLSLFEAVNEVDAGPIIKKASFTLNGDEMSDEINRKLFETEMALMDYAVENVDALKATPQPTDSISHYRKRTKADSRLDPQKSIAEQFNLLRISDPLRYPCFFDYRGGTYTLRMEKMDEGPKD
ncbi:MAG: methionyl-tRNA formyltransferase [Candidatus Promineifilaceae bacterium]|jgi:methionyl-tRNA formyltransferase